MRQGTIRVLSTYASKSVPAGDRGAQHHRDRGDERRRREAQQPDVVAAGRILHQPEHRRPEPPAQIADALIMASPPAAAAPVSMALGIDQKVGEEDCGPIAASIAPPS